jgi:spore maturation protein CgeB
MMDAPISANSYIYKSYELTEEEYHTYSCDICMVCHTSDVDGFITKFVNQFPENLREPVYVICQGYRSYVYETGDLFYSKEAFEQFISGSLVQHYGIMVDSATLEAFAEDMQLELNQRLFRQAIADWLIEAGYTNLKLWGDDWLKEKRYEKYAMGPAENGATLSKILQSSKIVLGNNVNGTGAAGVWETMLSGAFYMSNYVPPEEDYVDIRKDMTEGENLVIFHNKQDLLDKVAFYLSHEDERKQMAEKGTQFALEHRTYEALMKKMLCFLSEKFGSEV